MKNLFYILVLIAVVACSGFLSCASTEPGANFRLTNEEEPIRMGSIAVIRGSESIYDKRLSQNLIEELNKTGFDVISYEEINRILEKYPPTIVDFSGKGEKYTEPAISENTLQTLNSIQSEVKTEYILVVWTEDPTVEGRDSVGRVFLSIFTRLLKYPESNVVGYSYFASERGLGRFWSINTQAKAREGFIELLQFSAEQINEGISENLE